MQAASESELKWTEGDNVTDLDFADDIALIDETAEQLQKLTNSVIGLDINVEMTKCMKIDPPEAMWHLKDHRYSWLSVSMNSAILEA